MFSSLLTFCRFTVTVINVFMVMIAFNNYAIAIAAVLLFFLLLLSLLFLPSLSRLSPLQLLFNSIYCYCFYCCYYCGYCNAYVFNGDINVCVNFYF